MFTGIFTKILVGALGLSLLAGGGMYVKYNWFDKPAYEKEIRELQEAGIKAQAQKYRLENEVSFLKEQQAIREEKGRVKTRLRETIQEPTPDNFVEYTRRFRVQQNDKGAAPGGKKTGGPKDSIKPEASPAPDRR